MAESGPRPPALRRCVRSSRDDYGPIASEAGHTRDAPRKPIGAMGSPTELEFTPETMLLYLYATMFKLKKSLLI